MATRHWRDLIGQTIEVSSIQHGIVLEKGNKHQANIPICALEPVSEKEKPKAKKEVYCGKCGKKEPLAWLLAGHKCQWWRRLLYEREASIPAIVLYMVGIVTIINLDVGYIYKLILAILLGVGMGLLQKAVDKMVR